MENNEVWIATILISTTILLVYWVMGQKPRKVKPPISVEHQSEKAVDGSRRSVIFQTTSDDDCMKYLFDDCKTLYDCIYRGLRESGDGDCVGRFNAGQNNYEWFKYSKIIERAKNFGSGISNLEGLEQGSKTHVGIYATNSVEYIVAEYGCYHHSMVAVPLYDTLGPDACTYCINLVGMQCIVVDTEDRVQAIVSQANQLEKLKYIIVVGKMLESYKSKAKGFGITIYDMNEIEEMGKEKPVEEKRPRTSDVAVICFTSGTTGKPKGVVLSHENIVSNVSSVCAQLGDYTINKTDTMMSFLPLAHMFERCCEAAIYMKGGRVGFYRGDIKKLSDDMKILHPTVLPCVPRLLNRIHDKVYSMTKNSEIKKWMLQKALNSKMRELEDNIIRNDGFWDKLVFRNVRDNMGGKVRLVVTGSAPLAGEVLTFMRCALGCIVAEGYGQTESVCPVTFTFPGDNTTGHVGPPLPSAYVKIVDVPEMEYYARDEQGEVCIKGPTVFQGYFKNPEGTAEVIDNEGWLHTGDIGCWLPNGTLKIIDRKKHIFKLSQGEYIAPEKIEAVYSRSRFVTNIFVYGESLKASLVAIVVPDVEAIEVWARKNNIRGSSTRDLLLDARVKKLILDDMNTIGKKGGLRGFELVKDIFLNAEAFSIDNGLLTPTLKTKRPECRKVFVRQLEAMYRGLE